MDSDEDYKGENMDEILVTIQLLSSNWESSTKVGAQVAKEIIRCNRKLKKGCLQSEVKHPSQIEDKVRRGSVYQLKETNLEEMAKKMELTLVPSNKESVVKR